MSEIKTILNFFDKNNGLDAILKDLKQVKKLQAEINNQKGAVGSDNLKERAEKTTYSGTFKDFQTFGNSFRRMPTN